MMITMVDTANMSTTMIDRAITNEEAAEEEEEEEEKEGRQATTQAMMIMVMIMRIMWNGIAMTQNSTLPFGI